MVGTRAQAESEVLAFAAVVGVGVGSAFLDHVPIPSAVSAFDPFAWAKVMEVTSVAFWAVALISSLALSVWLGGSEDFSRCCSVLGWLLR